MRAVTAVRSVVPLLPEGRGIAWTAYSSRSEWRRSSDEYSADRIRRRPVDRNFVLRGDHPKALRFLAG
jgi:hypothetical protein